MDKRTVKIINLPDALSVWDHIDKDNFRMYTILQCSVFSSGDISITTSQLVKNGYRVAARLPIPSFIAFMEEFKRLANSEQPEGKKIVHKTGYLKGRKEDQQIIEGPKIFAGVNKEGHPWMSIVEKEPKEGNNPIVVTIKPKEFHYYVDSEGNDVKGTRLNVIYLNGWIDMIVKQITEILHRWENEVEIGNPSDKGNVNFEEFSF